MTRIQLLVLGTALLAWPPTGPARAEEPVELAWEQLIPEDARAVESPTQWGEVTHGQISTMTEDEAAGMSVVQDFNDKLVKIAGFMVPLDLDGSGITQFLLVPFFGACIHVPPPPPNQIVYVESQTAIDLDNPFDAVWVTGRLTTAGLTTELADVGYRITDPTVEPWQTEPWTAGMGGYLNQQK